MDVNDRFWTIATVLAHLFVSLTQAQNLSAPIIDSDGGLDIGQTFTALCHYTYNHHVIFQPSIQWTCETSSVYNVSDLAELPPHVNRTKLEVRLTIENISCSHHGIACECAVTANNAQKRLRSSTTLNLIVMLPPRRPKLILPVAAIEGRSFVIECASNVGSPPRTLEMYLDNDGVKSYVVTSESPVKDAETCENTDYITKTYALKRSYSGYKVVCMVKGSSKEDTKVLSIQFPVESATIKFNEFSPKEGETKSIAKGSTYTLQCLAESNPHPKFEFYFANNGSNAEQLELKNADYISRKAEESHTGNYSCSATTTFSNGEATIKYSRTFTLRVTEEASLPITTLIASMIGLALTATLGVVVFYWYIRRRYQSPPGATPRGRRASPRSITPPPSAPPPTSAPARREDYDGADDRALYEDPASVPAQRRGTKSGPVVASRPGRRRR